MTDYDAAVARWDNRDKTVPPERDVNADLIGYKLVIPGDPPSAYRVVGTDAVLGKGYVTLQHVDDPVRRIVRNAGTVRRRRELEQMGQVARCQA